jgi:hypothetical protein
LKGKKLWKELIRLLSVEGQTTMVVLAQASMGVFFIRSMSDTHLEMLILLKTTAGRRETPGELSRTTVSEES